MKPWETEPGVWKEYILHLGYGGLEIAIRYEYKTNLCQTRRRYLDFKSGYKAGFVAADNGDSESYYQLMIGVVL